MGLQAIQTTHKPKLYAPFYGVSAFPSILDDPIGGQAMLLSLMRFPEQPVTKNHTFYLDAPIGDGEFMYFASPFDLGPVEFLDLDSMFVGGWDGAKNDIYNDQAWGPIVVDITTPSGEVVPFYVYRTDHEELGPCNWQSRDET